MLLVDLVPLATPLVAALTTFELPAIDWSGLTRLGPSLVVAAVGLLAIRLLWSSGTGRTLRARIVDLFSINWQLALLGATGIVLSIASGWTTWDGMRNFTQEPLLSLLVTFGIQGVMLIVAWLIGESFATGMSHRAVRAGVGDGTSARDAGDGLSALRAFRPAVSAVVGILLFVVGFILVMQWTGSLDMRQVRDVAGYKASWWDLSDKLLFGAVGLLLVATLLLNAGNEVADSYLRSFRVMAKNAVLWVMFLACMATSVFFSFDSLFSTIFPKEERARAAELRAQNQVAGVVNDIAGFAVRRRIEEADRLFETQGWKDYEGQLEAVTRLASGAPAAIRAEIARELEESRQRLAVLQEKRANAEGGQASLQTRKTRLGEELARLTGERPEPASALAQQQAIVTEIERRLDEQRAKVLAEERGVEGSGKVGRGQFWREAKSNEAKVQSELEVARKRLDSYRDRLTGIDRRLSLIKSELAQIDGDLAKLKGEAATAEQLIGVASTGTASSRTEIFDPGAAVTALERARLSFRQDPTQAALAQIQGHCAALQSASIKAASLRDAAGRIDCDPGSVGEAAGRVFALNVGINRLQSTCVGGDKLPTVGGADALFQFARSCVQDSGLPSGDTETLRNKINAIELNRDDKAHRFVVTWNAFQDGNRLAYLALAIAIAIDSLVFMSGLFAANAVRSPLSDVPSDKGRSASHLDSIIASALGPDVEDNAAVALHAIRPARAEDKRRLGPGWTHEVQMTSVPQADHRLVNRLLSQAATIDAVHVDGPDGHFLVRGELVEYLAIVAARGFDRDRSGNVRLAELRKILAVSLQPDPGHYADVVLGHMHPISDREGFSQEVLLRDVRSFEHQYYVKRALNAGSTLAYVQKCDSKGFEDLFFTKKEFYRTLAVISADYPRTGHKIDLVQLAGTQLQHDGAARQLGSGGAPQHLPANLSPGRQLTSDTAPANDPRHGPPPSAPPALGAIGSHGVPQQAAPQPVPPAVPVSQPADAESAAQAGGPAAAQSDGDVRRAMLETLLRAVGIDPEIYEALSGPQFGAALGASEAFARVRDSNMQLNALLQNTEEAALNAIEKAHDALYNRLGEGNRFGHQMLQDVASEIDQNTHIIMLLPGGPFDLMMRQLSDELEQSAGEGRLNHEEQHLHRLVGGLRRVLAANPRTDEAEWDRLGAEFDGTLREIYPQVYRRDGDQKPMLN